MKKFSLAAFVVVLVLVNGDSPAITETHLEIIGRTEEPEEVQSSAEELKNLCECFRRSEPPSTCPFRVPVAVITNGTCRGDAELSRSFEERDQDNLTLTSSQDLGGPGCESAKVLLLVSSGNQGSVHTSASSVWLCPGSLDASLQKLVITGVDEVKIAPRILTDRPTDFTLSLDGIYQNLAFPTEALVVEEVEITNVDDVSNHHMESVVPYRQPQIKVVVRNASNVVTFETKSVSAPRVWVEVHHTEQLIIDTEGVKPYQDFILNVSSTHTLQMKTRAAVISKLQVTDVSSFVLSEESVTVKSDGQLTLRHVQDIDAAEKSIILGHGATLELTDVSFMSFYNRSFFVQSPLGSVRLSGVTVQHFNHFANYDYLCLTTHSLTMHNVTVSGCMRFVRRIERNAAEESSMALCEVSSTEAMADPCLCTDPRCRLCADLGSEHTTALPCHAPTTTTISGDVVSRRRRPPIHTVKMGVAVEGERDTQEEKRIWWKKPIYLNLLVVLIVAVLMLLSCCIYRLLKRSQVTSHTLNPPPSSNGVSPPQVLPLKHASI